MALVCVISTSVTNAYNLLPVAAKIPLCPVSTMLPSDISPEEITSFRLLTKINPAPKIPRKTFN